MYLLYEFLKIQRIFVLIIQGFKSINPTKSYELTADKKE